MKISSYKLNNLTAPFGAVFLYQKSKKARKSNGEPEKKTPEEEKKPAPAPEQKDEPKPEEKPDESKAENDKQHRIL